MKRADSYQEAVQAAKLGSRAKSEIILDRESLDLPYLSSRNSSIVSDTSYQEDVHDGEGDGKHPG